jgi:hypothetical protein
MVAKAFLIRGETLKGRFDIAVVAASRGRTVAAQNRK